MMLLTICFCKPVWLTAETSQLLVSCRRIWILSFVQAPVNTSGLLL